MPLGPGLSGRACYVELPRIGFFYANFALTAFPEVHYLQATLNRVKVRHLLYRHAVPPPQYLGCYTKRVRSRTFLPPRRVE